RSGGEEMRWLLRRGSQGGGGPDDREQAARGNEVRNPLPHSHEGSAQRDRIAKSNDPGVVCDGEELRALFKPGRRVRRDPRVHETEINLPMTQIHQLQRALLLIEQGRHEMAATELRGHLVEEPNDGFAQALLAICLLEQKQIKEAEAAAHDAIGCAPDLAFSHYALARVLSERNRNDEALKAIFEAIRLEPTDA